MLEEDRKRRQFEEQKQKLRLLSSVKPKVRREILIVFSSLRKHLLNYDTSHKVSMALQIAFVCTDWREESR